MKNKDFLLIGIGLVIGFHFGLMLLRLPYLTLDPKVNVVDLTNLIFLVGISLFVPFVINNTLDNNRCEKDLLIEEVSVLSNQINLISNIIESNLSKELDVTVFNKINECFKSSRQTLDLLGQQFSKFESEELNTNLAHLIQSFENYWIFVTGNNGVKPNNFSVSVGFYFNQKRYMEDSIRVLRLLRFSINKL